MHVFDSNNQEIFDIDCEEAENTVVDPADVYCDEETWCDDIYGNDENKCQFCTGLCDSCE